VRTLPAVKGKVRLKMEVTKRTLRKQEDAAADAAAQAEFNEKKSVSIHSISLPSAQYDISALY
jgi:hypothetical protein